MVLSGLFGSPRQVNCRACGGGYAQPTVETSCGTITVVEDTLGPEDCLNDEWWSGEECIPHAELCPSEDMVWDPAIEQCVPVDEPPAPGPCEGVTCPAGEVCVDGVCVPDDGVDDPDPCAGVDCPTDEECVDGACVPIDDEPPGGGRDLKQFLPLLLIAGTGYALYEYTDSDENEQ